LFDIDRLYSFSRVDVCDGAKSQMFLERYGGDGCDCDDERMMALMLFVAMAMRMKNEFAIIIVLLLLLTMMKTITMLPIQSVRITRWLQRRRNILLQNGRKRLKVFGTAIS
jgi:hypothetical protein